MGKLQKLGTGQGYLKAGFLGFPKSGKTFTATELALGVRSYMEAKGPVAFFDSEGGSEYVADRVRDATGMDLEGLRSMSFDDLILVARECEAEGYAALIVDSITHVWRELTESYLAEVNRMRSQKRLPRRAKLEFQDWAALKQKWATWTDLYLNSKLHIIICGRAGYEYDFETNEETGRKELVKTGTKMKTESEFGFEPSLLIEMERVKSAIKGKYLHRATVIGDRFGLIDGEQCDDPTFEFFKPHVARLKPGAHAPIDTSPKTQHDVDEEGGGREKRQRTIYLEEIQGELLRRYPSQSVEHKTAKADILDGVFETRSWTAVESMGTSRLKAGLEKIRALGTEGAAGEGVSA